MTLAVISGASRGVGRAVAHSLAARGVELALFSRPSRALDETIASLLVHGGKVRHYAVDLEDRTSIRRASHELLGESGAPDVLVHNAGIVERAPVATLTDEVWDRHFAVNLTAPFLLTRALLPAMLERRTGRILFVSSISAVLGSPTQSAYNATKAGLVSFMRCLAEELKDTGLLTAAVLPGAIDTDMLVGSGYPPRMSAAEVARTLTFLALDAGPGQSGSALEMFGV